MSGKESYSKNLEVIMFKYAITRRPGINFTAGLTSQSFSTPDFYIAMNQHEAYITNLMNCGLEVTVLEADNNYPDGEFVEDTAVISKCCAILAQPGAASRVGEAKLIQPTLEHFFEKIEKITPPGTLEGGDICQVENHFFIGLSERTNQDGAKQLSQILKKYGYTSEIIDCKKIPGLLHLKSGIAYLGEGRLAVIDELNDHPALKNFRRLLVPEEEKYAANCVRVNDHILAVKGFPRFLEMLIKENFQVLELSMSEFEKMDGGLSCLSLRF